MTSMALPEYVNVAPYEYGSSFGLSWEDYRSLARTALGIIKDFPATMGIYPLDGGGCILDIFTNDCQLIIQVDSKRGQISLHCADLDSVEGPVSVLTASNSEADWKLLGEMGPK